MDETLKTNPLVTAYAKFRTAACWLQTPFLLAVRLYWGWQFAQAGWGKLQDVHKVAGFFVQLHIPLPLPSAILVASLEFFGGILLILGLFSRITALLLTINMLVAYITADREALGSIFSSPDKFYAAAPYTFFFAALIIFIFGPGRVAVDYLLRRRLEAKRAFAPGNWELD